MAVELQKQRRRLLPLLSALEHLRRLLQEPGALERLAGKTSVLGELRVIRGGAGDHHAAESILEVSPVVLPGAAVVSRLSADLRRFQEVAHALEDVGCFGERPRLDPEARRFVVLAVALVALGGFAKTPALLDDLC